MRYTGDRYKYIGRNRWIDGKSVELKPWYYESEDDKNGRNLKVRYESDIFFGKAQRQYWNKIIFSETNPNKK